MQAAPDRVDTATQAVGVLLNPARGNSFLDAVLPPFLVLVYLVCFFTIMFNAAAPEWVQDLVTSEGFLAGYGILGPIGGAYLKHVAPNVGSK